jgi:hypothetical protein
VCFGVSYSILVFGRVGLLVGTLVYVVRVVVFGLDVLFFCPFGEDFVDVVFDLL